MLPIFLALALPARATPLFTYDPSLLPSPQPCASDDPSTEGCYSNQAQLVDIDGDGDLDLIYANGGGYYVPGDAQPLAVYRNDSTSGNIVYTDVTDGEFGGWTGRVRQVAVGDIDGDGQPEIIVPDGYGMQPDAVFAWNGATWEDQGATRLGTSSRAGAVRLADVDDDGDLDLFISDWGDAPPGSPGVGHLYANDGGGHFTEVVGALPSDLSNVGTGPIDADFVDVDTDNDLDLLIASREGDSYLLINDGSGVFTWTDGMLPKQPGPYVYGPGECDVDNDGDVDMWLDGGERNGLEELLINDGNGAFSDQTTARVTGNPTADDNAVICADVDQDGDMDAVIASLSDSERVLQNDGTGNFTLMDSTFADSDGNPLSDSTLGMAVGDIDGDGILDAVTGQGESGPDFLNKVYVGSGAIDTIGPTIRHFDRFVDQASEQQVIFHFDVQDGVASEVGPRLHEAYVELDGTPIQATLMGGDTYRVPLDLKQGAHTLKACAQDQAANESCTIEAVFAIGDVKPTCGCASAGDKGSGPALVGLAIASFALGRRRRS